MCLPNNIIRNRQLSIWLEAFDHLKFAGVFTYPFPGMPV